MKKIIFLILLPIIIIAQNNKNNNAKFNDINLNLNSAVGCQDLDETLIDIVSIFGDASLIEDLLGCQELIPTLESGILSAFLPFDIPLDCNTDLTPFGYLDVNLSDVCQCSCEPFLNIIYINNIQPKLIKKIDILGKDNITKGLHFELYNDGTVLKKYNIFE